jgi:hypothetical protein
MSRLELLDKHGMIGLSTFLVSVFAPAKAQNHSIDYYKKAIKIYGILSIFSCPELKTEGLLGACRHTETAF